MKANSVPRTRATDPLPPMPRRQSCDRCHEQKVRCVTEGIDGALILGGISEESEGSLAGHVVSSVPCVRCKKAGATCIYSRESLPRLAFSNDIQLTLDCVTAQLRSGRPRLRRDSSTQRPRKRARRVSRCSSSSSLSTSYSQAASPPAASQQAVSIPYSTAGMGLGIMSHPNEHVHGHLASQMNPLLMPPATPTYCDILVGSQPGPGPEAPPLPSQWQAAPPPYDSDSNQFIDMCQLSSFSEATPAPSIPCVPIFPDPAPTVASTTAEDMMGSYSWPVPAMPDYSLEELAHINLRIHMAGHSLPSPFRTLASLSSPAVNDVFDAACALINVVDRYAARHAATRRSPTPAAGPRNGYDSPSPQPHSAGSLSATIDTAFDSSITLMIHACHQALLGVFEELSASLLFYLTQPSSTPISTPPATPLSATFPTPPTPSNTGGGNNQAVDTANLMIHILTQLDRAIFSLPRGGSVPSSPQLQQQQGRKDVGARFATAAAGGVWRSNGSALLLDEMEQRQRRVRGQVKPVERMLGGRAGIVGPQGVVGIM